MTIGDAGLALIKSFEGYGRKLPDGGCTAYREMINGKLDIPTIGYGCTKGVKMGDVWTAEQAEQALIRELTGHAERVTRLVTITLNANERDALISFDYNCGGLTGNTLKAINSGDRQKAAAALRTWNKFGGKVCDGLVRRRAAEVALFLTPVEDVEPNYMPQSATQSMTTGQKVAAWSAPPTLITAGLAIFQAWKDTADGVAAAAMWVVSQPLAAAIAALTAFSLWLTTKVKPS